MGAGYWVLVTGCWLSVPCSAFSVFSVHRSFREGRAFLVYRFTFLVQGSRVQELKVQRYSAIRVNPRLKIRVPISNWPFASLRA